ncbi:hypothetical protein MKZ02_19355 [Pseudobacillus sp. FSL P4-0506]|uniref:hypothetical protein n=1 Tax=Pseudobacillus sp. FSL P4-0506 TaxID=2921576 RepID=UPI0030F7F1C6
MPTWLIIQLTVGFVWFIFWGLVYQFRLWKVGFPQTQKSILRFVFLLLFPLSWFLSLIIEELIFIINNDYFFLSITRLLIPMLLGIMLSVQYLYHKQENTARVEITKKISEKRQECLKWFSRFPFIEKGKINVQIYKSKDSIVGKAIVKDVTEEQAMELKLFEEFLPEDVSLMVIKKNL